jgi:hypothetical protein
MISDITVFAYPKALGRLVYPRFLVAGISALMRATDARGGCMTSDIALSIYPSVRRLQADWHIPGLSRRPASQLLILQRAQSN